MFDATEILQDEGHGISNGAVINMMFFRQEGVPLFHNAEVAPPVDKDSNESQLSVLTLGCGETLTVCNKYVVFRMSKYVMKNHAFLQLQISTIESLCK